MPTTMPLRPCLLATLCLLSLAAVNAQAQSSAMPQTNLSGSQNPAGKDVLARDARLNVKVSTRRRAATLPETLDLLSAMTKIKLKVEGLELENAQIGLRFQDAPLRTVLRSLATLFHVQWRRDPDNSLTLYLPPEYDFLRPRNEAQAEIYRKGRELLLLFAQTSEAFQNDMQNRHDPHFYAPDGVAFSDCPPVMQKMLGEMLATHLQDKQAAGYPSDFGKNNLNDTRVRLTTTPQNGATEYNLVFGTNDEGVSFNFTVFHDASQDYHVVPFAELKGEASRREAANERSRQQAMLKDARLKKRISLKLENATFAQALQVLASKADVDVLAAAPARSEKATLTLVNVSLKDALDRLCERFHTRDDLPAFQYHWSWGWQASGLFVFGFAPLPEERAAAESAP